MEKKLIKKQFLFKQEEVKLEGVGEVNGYVIHRDHDTIVMLMCNEDKNWDYFTLVKIERKRATGHWYFKNIADPIAKEDLHFRPKSNNK